jgi:hypothetical protein
MGLLGHFGHHRWVSWSRHWLLDSPLVEDCQFLQGLILVELQRQWELFLFELQCRHVPQPFVQVFSLQVSSPVMLRAVVSLLVTATHSLVLAEVGSLLLVHPVLHYTHTLKYYVILGAYITRD